MKKNAISVVLLAVENPQNGEEEIDDVEVQRDGCCDFLLNMIVSHNQLRVHQDVSAEDEGRYDSISELNLAVVWEECRHEAENDEYPERSKEVRHP